jgi:hypothetical protein
MSRLSKPLAVVTLLVLAFAVPAFAATMAFSPAQFQKVDAFFLKTVKQAPVKGCKLAQKHKVVLCAARFPDNTVLRFQAKRVGRCGMSYQLTAPKVTPAQANPHYFC